MNPQISFEVGPTYTCMCDASGAVALDETHFVVASDEPQGDGQNRLKLFRLGEETPVFSLDLNEFLGVEGEKPEADIEGATRVGDMVFWVTSHGRNSKGKLRPNRHRFFATRIVGETLVPWGQSYADLVEDMALCDPILHQVVAQKIAPEEGGLSVEGLCVSKEGALLLGLRSPLDHQMAIAVPLLNPLEILKGSRAQLGPILRLDLGGRGIRDFGQIAPNRWLILAGTSGASDNFALYQWNGVAAAPPVQIADLSRKLAELGLEDFHPESFFETGDAHIFLLSDDGDREFKTGRNKDLPDNARCFRSVRVTLL